MRSGFFTTLISVALLLPMGVMAQSLGELGNTGGEIFTLSVSPQYPAPYSTATLSFISGSLDLTNAKLAVSVGGKNVYQGSVQPVAVTLGRTGSITNVTATISSGGASSNQSLTIQPEDVVLITEPVSSSPPLYPGKSLVPIGGDVRVVAMANLRNAGGVASNVATYSYAWTVDGVQIANSSGIGKSAIMVASPLQYRTREVSVVVASADGSLVGGASLSLSSEQPSVRIYENDPLLGIRYEHALSGSFSISGTEATLYAAPFSLSTTGGAPLMQWFLNGASAQTGSSITLRPTGSGQGNASLSLTASAGQSGTATANLSLIFGATSGTNLFGL
ncbi:hypothetical protein D4R49_01130 [bacterium]|nr:MAG: hypothetical protein D4R49_01130 [bacterium]